MPPLQRQMYLSARRGAEWLSRMNGNKGRFEHGLLPALNAPLEGDQVLRQAGAAFALARAARHLREPNYTARATHAVLTLLEDSAVDPKNTSVRCLCPSAPPGVRLAVAALTVLAVHELPAPSDELIARAEQLCHYIRLQQRPDGSLHVADSPAAVQAVADDPDTVNHCPGQAFYALMRSQQRRPAAWKIDLVRKGLPYYLKRWRAGKDRDFVCWQTAAYAEAYLLTREKAFAEAVFEMNDWLCGLQYERFDPHRARWLGGFMACRSGGQPKEIAPDIGSARCAASLAEACRVTRQLPDLARHERYSAALERCLQFLTTLQYAEADTQHFADWYRPRLLGGFHASHQDGTLRIDHAQHAVSALVQYLAHVAQVQ